MQISMTSLMNTLSQLVSHEEESVEPTVRKMGSLQEHLMSVSRPSTVEVATTTSNELSVGPPPMYRKSTSSNVVGMPKKKGSRVIVWTQVPSTHQAA
ncbi:MAG: hypothetical protein JST89_06665 [Cyanobacteria bacterium SZAS-4]|nr:hypothetical protein [Cyanobacteria bacterium SZAS-4]